MIERIAELAIPPAWEDVWICPHPMGHIQATGIDARGRKQYIYHRRWRERRDQQKFNSMVRFARALPLMRRRVARDLGRRGLPRRRVLACAVRLVDRGFFRVGGEDYKAENETYGLATMHKSHVKLGEGTLTFERRRGREDEGSVRRRIGEMLACEPLAALALARDRAGLEATRVHGSWRGETARLEWSRAPYRTRPRAA